MEDDTSRFDILLRRIPTIKSFCLFIDVDTGTIIISFLGLVSGIIWLFVDIIYLSIVLDLLPVTPDHHIIIRHRTGILTFDTILQIGFCVSFSYLIYGHKKENARCVRGWLTASLVLILGKLISTLCFLIFQEFFIFIIALFYTGFHVYYFLVVNSYYQDMDDGGRHY